MADSYKPTDSMRSNAKRGLEWHKKYGRGGTEVGVKRASDIARGAELSADTVKRMHSFFSRHQKNSEGTNDKGEPSNGKIAWLLWGGDSGASWAASKVSAMENVTEYPLIGEAKKSPKKRKITDPETGVDITPNKAMKQNAANGINLARKSGIGSDVGKARARALALGKMTTATVKRMNSFFTSRAVDRKSPRFGSARNPTPAYIAWQMWGGDDGAKWAARKMDQIMSKKVQVADSVQADIQRVIDQLREADVSRMDGIIAIGDYINTGSEVPGTEVEPGAETTGTEVEEPEGDIESQLPPGFGESMKIKFIETPEAVKDKMITYLKLRGHVNVDFGDTYSALNALPDEDLERLYKFAVSQGMMPADM